MEAPNENQFRHYYHQLHHHHQSPAADQPSNGLLPSAEASHMVYPHSLPSAVSAQLEPAKRKRGRPRKYGTPEQALAAKKATLSASKDRTDHHLASRLGAAASASASSSTSFSKRSHLDASGQGFSPHVINVVAGEDVSQKILVFMQQSKREICVLSGSGSISNPSLRQPVTAGSNITYEGQFEIISLSGSYIHNEVGGRSGGLTVCLSSTDGQVIGGVVVGQLNAAGPAQIIVGTFLSDTKKEAGFGAAKGGDDKLSSAVGGPIPSLGFRSVEPTVRNPISSRVSNDNNQSIGGGSHFMVQSRGMDMTPAHNPDWRSGLASYDFTGRIGHGGHQSPENGEYDNITE